MILLQGIKQRYKQLLGDIGLWIAVLIGFLVSILSYKDPKLLPILKIGANDLVSILFSYASISFGAAIAGAGFSLALPGNDRIHRWSKIQGDPFAYLIFIFAWSAVSQVILMIFSTALLVFEGRQPIDTIKWMPGLGAFLLAYSIYELFCVILAIMQLADAISAEEKVFPDSGKKK